MTIFPSNPLNAADFKWAAHVRRVVLARLEPSGRESLLPRSSRRPARFTAAFERQPACGDECEIRSAQQLASITRVELGAVAARIVERVVGRRDPLRGNKA